ncbi:hypothetical protein LTR62_008175 [Meristemomyces frigidus]|uniref:Glutaredoxin domain-containing protein n=1 Tax=Meristemomyces frigidus TaxID=1508187 RepID=A0AAN7TB10_9PEZI|nr:hypothetical protein LTR62_008175 [Meristemomyces frigidus]
MPSSRRLKVTALIAILTVLIIVYVTTGARSTQESAFYTRTVQAIKDRQATEARDSVIADEKARTERVERLQKEHDFAVSAAASEPASTKVAGKVAAGDLEPERQKPLAADVQDAVSEAIERTAPVAGKKIAGEKVVSTKPASVADHDGVAKVGNVEPKPSTSQEPGDESEEDHKVETLLNDILKKGPIIIFSKTFCPYSKKAKHILLDLYTISPPPFVVELDREELGPGLQGALAKMTGRRTVPNVLVNGKSIGGGDDVAGLHRDGKLAETLRSMGGKRVVEVKENEVLDVKEAGGEKREVRFKA